ncbi:MAG: DUF4249 domain-containing protein [Flavobacteriaceae bacterium]
MKKHIILFIYILTAFTSCEDVVDIDLNTTEPKLVIEASINWEKGTLGNEQEIKLSLTAPYYDSEIPPANGAIVTVTDTNSNTYNFIEDNSTGIYKNTNFTPILNETYTLTISYSGEIYTATETLTPVVDIDSIEQEDEGGFLGDQIELKVYYNDPANEDNYYLFEFLNTNITDIPDLEVYDDEFSDGNQIFGFYTHEDLETGDVVNIKNYGVSERFYNYMSILTEQAGEGGGPFGTQPTTVRGNCINQTNSSNFPLGYFRLSEVDVLDYTIQ